MVGYGDVYCIERDIRIRWIKMGFYLCYVEFFEEDVFLKRILFFNEKIFILIW